MLTIETTKSVFNLNNPLDYYYKLAYHKVAQIRVEYEKQNRTLILSEKQQEALRTAIQCVGRRIGLYPIKP